MKPIIIDLAPLYDHAVTDLQCISLPLKTKEGRAFSKVIKECLSSIPKQAGFYTWFKAGVARPIYVGKASEGKTCHLHARLLEEVKEERGFLWAGELIGHTEDHLHAIWQDYYPDQPGKNGGRRHITRSIRKRNSTHIVVIPAPSLDKESVGSIENHLIKMLAPEVNASLGKRLPEHTEYATQIAEIFRSEIGAKLVI